MKNTLDHLPENKQRELARVVDVIRAASDDVEMVILFGSYARGDYKVKADLKPDRWSGHRSDYDILVVTSQQSTAEDSGLLHDITNQCGMLGLSTSVRAIVHDVEYLNIQLAEEQYFFSDIKKEGCWLFNAGKHKLASPRELKPQEKRRIAQDHYDHWFESATNFYSRFEQASEDGEYKNAAFQLHQAAEAAYKTILLVFTNYCPDEHLLRFLGHVATDHHAPLAAIFPQETRAEQDRFEQLDRAYIGARYHPSYRISREELEHLAPCVRKLLEVTKTICQSKLERLGAGEEESE